jgi:hypothetical protein
MASAAPHSSSNWARRGRRARHCPHFVAAGSTVGEAAGDAADPVAGSHLCPARPMTVFGFVGSLDAR